MSHQKMHIPPVNDEVAGSVARYIPTINKQTNPNKLSSKLVIQEAVSPEVSTLNNSVKNKKQGDQMGQRIQEWTK